MNWQTTLTTVGIALLLILSGSTRQNQTQAKDVSEIASNPLAIRFERFSQRPTFQSAQTSQVPQAKTASPKQMSREDQLAKANTQFGFKLFSALISQDKNKNVFVSPTSVAIALDMLYNGASGTTQQEMAQALALHGISRKELNTANQALQEALQKTDEQVQLAIANSLWAREGVSFQEQFLKTNRQYYNAQITSLDFSTPDTIDIINRWVQEKTSGKIKEIIDSINSDDVLFLINAIYFKGNWTNEFDKNLTREQPFYLSNGSSKQHPLMSRQGQYQYYENQDFQAASLPYGNESLSLYIFLPEQDSNLNTFLQQLTPEKWNQWLSQFRNKEGLVKLPRFKLEYEIELKDVLSTLGMQTMFEGSKADFSQMTANQVKVDRVKHKTFVEVNEEGTEAAAVTSIGVRATSAMPVEKPFSMVVDRPFFCAIRDNQTGTVLFMGSIVEPQ